MGWKKVLGDWGDALSRAVHGGEEGLTAKMLAAAQDRARKQGRDPDKDMTCRQLSRQLDQHLGL